MPYFVNDDLTATELDWTADKAEISRRLKAGEECYGTLAGTVLHAGVTATAFHHPVKAELVYDGLEALNRPLGAPLPDPIGTRSTYRVVVLDGAFHHPPLHMDDARRRSLAH